ncbi:MAG TPA: sigma-54 dependent transcriptional regulator [Candidatus Binatia bacterium]|jgi:DNA-binding NtrC family response regulator
MARILIIEQQVRVATVLEKLGHRARVKVVRDTEALWEKLGCSKWDLIIWSSDSDAATQSDMDETLRRIFIAAPRAKVIILTEFEKPDELPVNMCVRWWQHSLSDEQISVLLDNELRDGIMQTCQRARYDDSAEPVEFEGIWAVSPTMRSVIRQILEAAAEDIPVLITGATGTGKDLAAAAIHNRSKRRDTPYLPVNMGAIAPELIASELFGHERGAFTGAVESRAGCFEQARAGTIFLDEIATMDARTQISLLRVLETKTLRRVGGEKDVQVNARVIAATNENMENVIKLGRFREDLFYRLDVFRIHLPPLRERTGDINLLTDRFIAKFDAAYKTGVRGVADDFYHILNQYPWPGNVRELKNLVQRTVLMAKAAEITPDLLPKQVRQVAESESAKSSSGLPIRLGMTLSDAERELIKMTLVAVRGNKLRAASMLGICRRALYNKLKRYALI